MSPIAWTAVFSVAAGLLTFALADVPVSRHRLATFATRHRITVTVPNAQDLVRYLALTRRWRAAGLVTATAGFTLYNLQHQRVSIDLLIGLSGWFAGAVVAELRVTGPLLSRRAASLTPRLAEHYATRTARSALAATAWLAALGAVVAIIMGHWPFGVVSLGAAAGLPLLVLGVSRRVAVRRQPTQPPDVVAADEAVRRNAVQALNAAAATLLAYAAAGPLLMVVARGSAALAVLLTLGCMVGIPLLGRQLGPAGTAARTPQPAASASR